MPGLSCSLVARLAEAFDATAATAWVSTAALGDLEDAAGFASQLPAQQPRRSSEALCKIEAFCRQKGVGGGLFRARPLPSFQGRWGLPGTQITSAGEVLPVTG